MLTSRRMIVALVATPLLVLTACGGGNDDGDRGNPGPSTSAELSGPTLCPLLDLTAIGQAFGGTTTIRKPDIDYSPIGLPTFDACALDLARPGKPATRIDVSVSALAMNRESFATLQQRDAAEARRLHGSVQPMTGLGDAAYVNDMSYVRVLAHGRALEIAAPNFQNVSDESLVAAARLALPKLEQLPSAPPSITRKECDAVAQPAAALLGRQVEVTRGGPRSKGGFHCAWGTQTDIVAIQARVPDDSSRLLRAYLGGIPTESVSVGDEGHYMDGTNQVYFRKGKYTVIVGHEFGGENKTALVGFAQAVANTLR